MVTVIGWSVSIQRLMTTFSAAEVGASGWKTFELSLEWRTYTFDHSVPTMQKGNADLIGPKKDGVSTSALLPATSRVERQRCAISGFSGRGFGSFFSSSPGSGWQHANSTLHSSDLHY